MSRCPRCHGFTRREPARVFCVACGREHIVADVPDGAVWLQILVDFALRPRSIECLAPLAPGEDGWWPPVAPARRL